MATGSSFSGSITALVTPFRSGVFDEAAFRALVDWQIDSATALASTLTGYRAGLLGSIAASCTTSATVGLDIPKPAP